MIDDLIDKCHHTIQNKLATGEEDPTDLLELAECCQRIKQAVKKVSRNKYMQDQNTKQEAARKNNGSKNNGLGSNKAIISVSGSNAALAPPNFNLTFCIARLSQPRAQINAPAASMQTSTPVPTTSGPLRLTKKEMERLKKFGRCFNCKQERHAAWRCMQPARLYLAVSKLLQKVMPVKDNASKLEKN